MIEKGSDISGAWRWFDRDTTEKSLDFLRAAPAISADAVLVDWCRVSSRFMPFPDEPTQVTIVDYQPGWPSEFDRIAGQLREVLGRAAIAWP